jgi:hypothetical protein
MSGQEIDLTPLIALLAELFPGAKEPCWGCGADEVFAKGLCRPCYGRWDHAGRPEQVPERQRRPRRNSRAVAFRSARAMGASVPQAARNAGIPEYVGWRYDTRLQDARRAA